MHEVVNKHNEIYLKQGSNAWLEWRKQHITATDSAKIMGKNPWSTALDCYDEKINGKTTFISAAMQKGMDSEPLARECLIATHGINLSPKVFRSLEYPLMGASLDAVSDDNKIVYEIKCVGEKTMERALKGEIAPMYIIQCNKQMLVMGLDSMFLFYYFNDFLHHTVKVERDEKLIDEIIKSDTKFWNDHILPHLPPEKHGEDYNKIQDEKANDLALQWFELSKKEKEAKEAKDEILKQLEEFTDHKNCIFPEAGLKYQIIERKGTIDWNKACVAWSISDDEVEKYRKDKSSYSKLSEM